MPNIDTIMVTLINEILPSGIQFVMALIALAGLLVILFTLINLYNMISENRMQTADGTTVSGSMVRLFVGGMMVIPSVILWRAADMFISGGSVTEASVLAYVSGTPPTTTCDRFASAVQLMFLLVGLIALYFAFRNADDQARGFNRNGYRTAVPYALGGIACIFVEDIVSILGTTFSLDVGFTQLCTALG